MEEDTNTEPSEADPNECYDPQVKMIVRHTFIELVEVPAAKKRLVRSLSDSMLLQEEPYLPENIHDGDAQEFGREVSTDAPSDPEGCARASAAGLSSCTPCISAEQDLCCQWEIPYEAAEAAAFCSTYCPEAASMVGLSSTEEFFSMAWVGPQELWAPVGFDTTGFEMESAATLGLGASSDSIAEWQPWPTSSSCSPCFTDGQGPSCDSAQTSCVLPDAAATAAAVAAGAVTTEEETTKDEAGTEPTEVEADVEFQCASALEEEGLANSPPKTTVMMRNLPAGLTRAALLELLEGEGFEGSFDFVYLPMDFASKVCLGYAFVNFISASDAERCWQVFEGFTDWGMGSEKACTVTWGDPYQGLDAHVERYQNSPVMHHSVPDEWKPIILQAAPQHGPSREVDKLKLVPASQRCLLNVLVA